MVPLGEILDPLEELIRGEKVALISIPILSIAFGGVIVYESPGSAVYFLVYCMIMAVFIYFALKRYRHMKALYRKIEDWPYTSREALKEAHATITSFVAKIFQPQWGMTLIACSSLFQLLYRESSRNFLRELFSLKGDTDTWVVILLTLLLLIPVHFLAKRQQEKLLNKNYREPLNRLQEIINRL